MTALNDLKCRNITCPEFKKDGTPQQILKIPDGTVPGLSLWVFRDTGAKYWRFRYYRNGGEKLLGLGAYPATGLAAARAKAETLRDDLKAGRDPSQVRQKAAKETKQAQLDTFKYFATEWHETKADGWSTKYGADVLKQLETYAYPILGKMPVRDIEAPDIVTVCKKVQAGGLGTSAFRLLSTIRAVLDFAINSGKLVQNVAVGREGALKTVKQKNRAYVPQKEFPKLVKAIATYDQIGSRQVMLALQLITLVFTRANELLQAEWSEFNFEKLEWEIPASRMKKDRVLLVPLAPEVVSILNELKLMNPNSKFILPGRGRQKGLGSNSLLNALRLLGYGKIQSVHGFRHIASTHLNEARNGDERMFDDDAIEAQLAHVTGGTRGRYNKAKYLAERRRIMNYWADYVCGLLKDKTAKEGEV